MGKRNVTLEEEENLGNEVKKYPCLYDKTIASYKDIESISNAWKEIENVLGLPEGEGAKRYENLKKRYSKKKMAFKYAWALGEGTPLVEAAEKDLKQYDFLNWLNAHLRLRKPNKKRSAMRKKFKTDHLHQKEENDTSANEVTGTGDDSHDGVNLNEDCDPGIIVINPKQPGVYSKPIPITATSSHKVMISSVPIKKKRVSDDKMPQATTCESEPASVLTMSNTLEEMPITSASSSFSTATSSASIGPNKDADDIFGMMVASELKAMKKSAKFRLKYEINNLIYKFHEWEQEQEPQVIQQEF
ncbi:uncharacterized protein LOC135696710 [Rhopilema esculentum]|uniref:uncharacterized protein LOC135696710 n=1 Tax=Rhopilema esculentum TaxID=499914 RepID=UPI0031DA7185|eukprot:gene12752-3480_t